MKEAREEEKEIAESSGDVVQGPDGKKKFKVLATFDGGWQKRPSSKIGGYSSLTGHASLIGYHTGKVIGIGTKNLYCKVCWSFLENGKVDKEKENFPRDHNCTRNHELSPGAMEPAILIEILNELLDDDIIVNIFIGDGDSASLAAVREKNPYVAYGLTVEKWDCYLHATRNYANKLRTVAANASNLSAKFSDVMKAQVRSIIKKRNTELQSNPGAKDDLIQALHKDIMTLPKHVLKDHSACPESCPKKHDDTEIPVQLDPTTAANITNFTSQLARLSNSLIQRVTTNRNESFNAVQNKFSGQKRVFFGGSRSARTR